MRRHDEFEWDAKKAQANIAKHKGVTFQDAAAVLADDQADLYHLEIVDDAHSLSEIRHITIGSNPEARRIILTICWTDRAGSEKWITRIISARRATRKEKIDDGKEISGR